MAGCNSSPGTASPASPASASAPTASASSSGDVLASYHTARAALDRSIVAIGGIAALAKVSATGFSYTGTSMARGQSVRPDAEYAVMPVSGKMMFAPGKRRIYAESDTTFPGGIRAVGRTVVDGDGGFRHLVQNNAVVELNAFDLRLLRGGASSNPEKLLPHALLWTAVTNPSSLRWTGSGQRNGQAVERITFAGRDGQAMTMVLDATTHLPVAVETVSGPIGVGDSIAEVVFGEYRPIDGIQVSHRIEFRGAGESLGEWRLSDVAMNPAMDDALFQIPAGKKASEYQMASYQPQKLGEGLYAVRLHSGFGGSYNAMFAVFDDHVAVVEAPLVDALSQVMVNIIGQVAPGKEIRYVIPTHYHHDHIGGIAAYVRAGVTVLTTRGNKPVVERLATARGSLIPGAINLQINGLGDHQTAKIEIIDGSRVLQDGSQELRLYDVGPNPHVDEILVAYAPRQKVLFVSDLFSKPINGHFGPVTPALEAFAEKLEELGLEVETIVPGHGPVATRVDLDRALGRGR